MSLGKMAVRCSEPSPKIRTCRMAFWISRSNQFVPKPKPREAVSYTHLDVYKRQGQVNVKNNATREEVTVSFEELTKNFAAVLKQLEK